ncbi:uncharacterized protein [Eurosta solidaginis]|uniref:uncharacterized protein n=1 Tax=Eurosta solidaginis TaxID=178769 RepID=UPI0035314631
MNNTPGTQRNPFFDKIGIQYGQETKTLFKAFATNNIKLAKLRARKFFLLKCRKNNIIPKHIINNVSCTFQSLEDDTPYNKQIGQLISDFRRKILNLEIKISFWKINRLEQQINNLRSIIQSRSLPNTNDFFRTQEISYQNRHEVTINNLNTKYNKLESTQIQTHITSDTTCFIHNATTINLPKDVMLLMGLGPNFGLPTTPNKLPTKQIIAEVECIMQNCVDPQNRNEIRQTVTRTILQAKSTARKSNLENFLLQKEKSCIQFFKNNPEIICTRSDKGNKSVFMYKKDLLKLGEEMLSDTDTYNAITDPTNKIQIKNNLFVKTLFNRGKIDSLTKRKLTTYNANPPRIYFAPKHHKNEIPMPLRPISADYDGPTTALSRYATAILAKIPKSQFHICNSFEFKAFIAQQTHEPGQIQVSFDVKSLFTNASVDSILRILNERWREIESITNLSQSEFIEMITLCTKNSYFQFNEQFYAQNFGCPMGSPISCILVEILMDNVLERAIQRVKEELEFNISIIKKYVDDLYLLLPEHILPSVLKIFNAIEPGIEFTFEKEQQNMLPFLDMVIFRNAQNGTFNTDWYRKPVSSGRILNYRSIHPLTQKISTAKGLINRVLNLSDEKYHNKNKLIIKGILKANDYPPKLVSRLINHYKISINNKNTDPILTSTNAQQQLAEIKTMTISYFPYITKCITNKFKEFTANVRFAYKNKNNVGKMYNKIKDKIPTNKEKNVVYKIDCIDCQRRKSYIGTTSQHLYKRLNQHRKTVEKKETEKSALALHAITFGHRFDFEGTKVLAREKSWGKRILLEEIFIKADKNCVNKRSVEAKNISDIYTCIF